MEMEMEIVGMISGGKDSIYNLMCAVRYGIFFLPICKTK